MEELLVEVAKRVTRKYYGKYRGFVVDNQDPKTMGRVRLRVPSLMGTAELDWALPCLPFGGLADQGWFSVPEVGAQVWVEFEEGELSQPIWTGTFWQSGADVPAEAALEEPTTRVLKTPAGHLLQFDDKDGEEKITLKHASDAMLEIDEKGTVAITDSGGAKVVLDADAGEIAIEDANGNTMTMTSSGITVEDANGNTIEMASSGITVKGQQIVVEGSQVMLGGQGGEFLIKGQSFLSLFATHMHPTPMGPSGPPVPQGEMSSLSTKVMTA